MLLLLILGWSPPTTTMIPFSVVPSFLCVYLWCYATLSVTITVSFLSTLDFIEHYLSFQVYTPMQWRHVSKVSRTKATVEECRKQQKVDDAEPAPNHDNDISNGHPKLKSYSIAHVLEGKYKNLYGHSIICGTRTRCTKYFVLSTKTNSFLQLSLASTFFILVPNWCVTHHLLLLLVVEVLGRRGRQTVTTSNSDNSKVNSGD